MSHRWPGWRTHPGIEIAPLAEKARAQGEPWKQYSYVWDTPDQNYVTVCGWQVDADGDVSTLGDGWEAIIEDGILKGFRGQHGGTIEELVEITGLVIPEGEPPWSPALNVRLPPEQIGAFRRGDSMADGIDIDSEEPRASIAVGFQGADGSWTQAVWGITLESAASVIALMQERHGEPMAELTTDPAGAAAFYEASRDAVDAHTVYTCTHDAEDAS